MSRLGETPPLPVTRGPLGLLAFAADERKVHRPIEQLRAILDGGACPRLTLDERAALLHMAYVQTTVTGRPTIIPPLLAAPREDWARWFRSVGFLHGGYRVPGFRPSRPVRLWRGATREYARGLSWVAHRPTAEHYAATRRAQIAQARAAAGKQWKPTRVPVFEVVAEPAWLLAMNAPSPFAGHGTEYVVDLPADVEIHRLEGARP